MRSLKSAIIAIPKEIWPLLVILGSLFAAIAASKYNNWWTEEFIPIALVLLFAMAIFFLLFYLL